MDMQLVDNGNLDGLFGSPSGGRQREFGFAGTALAGGEAHIPALPCIRLPTVPAPIQAQSLPRVYFHLIRCLLHTIHAKKCSTCGGAIIC